MEVILEIVFSFLWEIALQAVVEGLLELGFHSFGDGVRQRIRNHRALAALGIAMLGCLGGVVTSIVWPTRVFVSVPLPGASLLLSPVVSGFVMEHVGRWLERRGHARSHISTYWGGALFAFAMALVRFLWVGV